MTAVKHNVGDLIWKSPGSGIEILSFGAEMTLSDLYVIRVTVKSEDPALAFSDMLHAEAEIALKAGEDLDSDRLFTGIITGLSQNRTRHGNLPNATGKNYLYHMEIRPKMWMLTQQTRSKVFQQKDVKDIVSEILDEHGVSHDWKLNGSPPKRDYCIQYNESDYDFISRLLEDEGVTFYFNHKDKKTVFSDHAGGHTDIEPFASVMYVEEISPRMQFGKQEFIRDFFYEERVGTGKFSLNHNNYETFQTNIKADDEESKVPNFNSVEIYEHSQNYKDKSQGKTYTGYRKEAMTAACKAGGGLTSSRGFEPGYTFTMTDHFRKELNKKWLITGCTINAEQGKTSCQFQCLPADVPFRPARKTEIPKIFGFQTATVTGPDGAEVYLDKMGRCKLQFHWDREGNKDDRASMWVRVANNYAGKDYGIQFIPRVGHEVLVSFLDGNPDHPVVTGRVYNDFNSAPLGPPNKWQNMIKTIKDNHIIFDDEDGKEMVDVRAEKDMTRLVMNNDSTTVNNDQTITVQNDRTITVNNNQTETVAVDNSQTIGSNDSLSVGNEKSVSVGTNYTETIGATKTSSVSASESHSVGTSRSVNVGASHSETVGASQNIMVGAAQTINVTANQSTTVGGNATISAGGVVGLNAGGGISLMCGGSAISVTPAGITISMGASVVSVNPAGVTIMGPMVKLN